jgi:sporulation protein YlmC with PRC-barrel domain
VLASELLGAQVLDRDGEPVGRVDDVRVVQDGPLVEGFGNGLRVSDLVVGPGGIAVRLGYVRHGVRGPALVRALARLLERRGWLVPWDQVGAIEPGRVELTVPRSELRSILDLEAR